MRNGILIYAALTQIRGQNQSRLAHNVLYILHSYCSVVKKLCVY